MKTNDPQLQDAMSRSKRANELYLAVSNELYFFQKDYPILSVRDVSKDALFALENATSAMRYGVVDRILADTNLSEVAEQWNDAKYENRAQVDVSELEKVVTADDLPFVVYRVCCPYKQDQLVELVRHDLENGQVEYLRLSNAELYENFSGTFEHVAELLNSDDYKTDKEN